MQRKKSLWILITILITTVIASLPAITKASPDPTMSVSPMIVTDVSVGNTFTVNLDVADVQNIWGYQIYLKYNTTILTATSFKNLANLTYAPFNEPAYSAINDTAGYVVVAYSSFYGDKTGGITTVDPVSLASVTFQVDAEGTCKLEFGALGKQKTKLADNQGNAIDPEYPGVYPILLLVPGHFSNVGEVQLHDVAVTKVEASPTEAGLDDVVSIEVTVKNNGGFNETFAVSTYYSKTHKIQTLQITNLEPGASESLTFTWNTLGVAEGSYVVSAKAELAIDDNPVDNTLSGNTVKIGTPATGWTIDPLYIAGGIVVVVVVAVGFYAFRARKK